MILSAKEATVTGRGVTRMKKALALLLACLLLIPLAACGSGDFSLGRFEGNEYHNDMLSLYFRLPASWHRADAAEAETLLGMKRTVFDTYDEESLAAAEKDKAFDLGYAFVLSTDGGLDRFDLLFQKNTGDGDSASYIASAREQLEKYGDLWEIRTVSNETVTVAGHEYVALEMVLKSGETVLRYYYLTTVAEGYFVTMILTTSLTDYSFSSFLSTLDQSSVRYYGLESK